jgi:hypothetical protein
MRLPVNEALLNAGLENEGLENEARTPAKE